jgi:hypothetical protein
MACRAPMAMLSKPYCILAVAITQQMKRHLRFAQRDVLDMSKALGVDAGADGAIFLVSLYFCSPSSFRCMALALFSSFSTGVAVPTGLATHNGEQSDHTDYLFKA